MLIKKDNQIEIWSDGWNKGYTFLITLLLLFAILSIIAGITGFSNGDIVKGIAITIIIPLILVFISIKLFLREKERHLILVVNSNYITIYSLFKKDTILKKIPLSQITNINIINSHSRYYRGLLAEIIYNEDNKPLKYSFEITNVESFKTAIREYRKDLLIK